MNQFIKDMMQTKVEEGGLTYETIAELVESIATLKRDLAKQDKLLDKYIEQYNETHKSPFQYESDSCSYTLKTRNTQKLDTVDILNYIKNATSTDQDYIAALEEILKLVDVKKSHATQLGVLEHSLIEISEIKVSKESYTLSTTVKRPKK